MANKRIADLTAITAGELQQTDLLLLSEKYAVLKSQAVDMFPHTHHIENVALLELR